MAGGSGTALVTPDDRVQGPGGPQGTAPPVAESEPPGPRQVGRVVARVLLVVLLGVVLVGGWVAFRGWQAVTALQDARSLLGGVELDTSDVAAAADDLTVLREHTRRAAAAASDPVWRAVEHVPWAGDQLEAVRVVATSLDAVVADALPAVADLRSLVDGGLRGPDGRFDVTTLKAATTRIGTAAATSADARAAVAALDTDALVGPLANAVVQVRDAMVRVDAAIGPAGRVSGVLPGMLGADGPRTYLVLALNTGELRPAGGIVGVVVAVRVEDGAVSIVDRRTTADLPKIDQPVVPLTPEEVTTWGDRLGRWIQNSVLTPDFPRTAELVAARWTRDVGGTVDGVLATDAVAVSELVRATGPVPDPDGGSIDAAGLVGALLRDAYLRHPDPAAADAYFGAVASGVVEAVGAGAGEPQALVAAGRRAVDERRLRVWSAHPKEQERLAATVAGGAYSSDLFADAPGVFLEDATRGKLGAYLATEVVFRDARCTGPAPSVSAVLRLDFQPPGGLAEMTPYVTGFPEEDVPVGTLLTTVSVWSGRGAPPLVVTRDGAPVTGQVSTLDGRTVLQIGSRLTPGQTQEVVVELPLRDGAVTLWTTPTLTSPGVATFRCG